MKSRKLWKRIAISLVVLVLVVRFGGVALAPSIVNSILEEFGFEAEFDDIDVSMFYGEVRIHGLSVHAIDDASAELVHLQHAVVDVDISSTLALDPLIRRAEVDGLEVFLERESEGLWNVAPFFALLESEPGQVEPEPETSDDPPEFSVQVPIKIDAVRVQDIHVFISDAQSDPPLDSEVTVNITGRDIGHPGEESSFEVIADATNLLEFARVEARTLFGKETVDSRFKFEMRGANTQPLTSLLAEFGVESRGKILAARGAMHTVVSVEGEDDSTLAVESELTSWQLQADDAEILALDELSVRTELSEGVAVPEVRITGCRARTRQEIDGQLSLAGFSWRGLPNGAEAAPEPTPEAEPEREPADGEPFLWSLDLCKIRDGRIVHEDALSKTETELNLDNFELADLESTFAKEGSLLVEAHGPEMFTKATTTGSITSGPSIALDFVAEGCTFQSIAPQLRRMGIVPRLADGEARATVNVAMLENGTGLDVDVEDAWFEDGDARTGIEEFRLEVVSLAPEIRIREVAVSGGEARLARLGGARFAFAGFELGVPPAADQPAQETPEPLEQPAAQEAPAPAPWEPFEVPAIRIDKISLGDSKFQFTDLERTEGNFELQDVRVDVSDLGLGIESKATVEAELDFRGICRSIDVVGFVQSKPGLNLYSKLDLGLTDLSGECLSVWLADLGLTPVFETADAIGTLELGCAQVRGGIRTQLEFSKARFGNEDTTFASLESFKVPYVDLLQDEIQVGAVVVSEPALFVARDEEGRWSAMGFGLASEGADRKPQGSPVEASASEPTKSEPAPAKDDADGPTISLVSLDLERARLNIADATKGLGDVRSLEATSSLTELVLGSKDKSNFEARVDVEGHPAVLTVQGELRPDPKDLALTVEVRGTKLDGGILNQYLPPSIQLAFQEAELHSMLDVELEVRPDSVMALRMEARDARIEEPGEDAYAKLGNFKLVASAIDLNDDRIIIDELSSEGLRLEAARLSEGAFQVAGLRLAAPEPTEVEVPETEEEKEVVQATEVSWARRYDSAPLPIVRIDKLDLELDRLRIVDETQSEEVPLELSVRVWHEKPLEILSREPEDLDPIELQVDMSATPIITNATTKVLLAPWEDDATVKLACEATGIRGDGITEFLPELSRYIDGSELTDGRASANFEARLIGMRRNPLDFDLRNGFGFEIELDSVEYGQGETVFAGLEAFDLSVERFNPETGDTRISNIELTGIRGEATLSGRGLTAGGITLLEPTDDEVEPAAAEPAASETVAAAPAEKQPYSGPEIKVDRAVITGLDFVLHDQLTDPPRHIPIDSLDVSVERFTTDTLTSPRPFRFAAYVGAGLVSLPKPKKTHGALAGIAGAARAAISGKKDKFEYEDRPVFDELTLSGTMSLGPYPKGRLNASASGLELLTFSGIASRSGVIIGSGVLDSWARVQMKGEKGISVRSSLVFTDLSLDEPPNGPISTYLKLPAPLDTVLFALENKDDEHRIPMNFDMGAKGLTAAKIAAVAATTMTEVIASAVASAPLRVGDGVSEMLGLPGGDAAPTNLIGRVLNPVLRVFGLAEKPGPRSKPVDIAFEPGQYALSPTGLAALESMLEEVEDRKDLIAIIEHSYGEGDMKRAERLANPTREECEEIAIGLRRRKWTLLRKRSELASDVTASFAVKGQEGTLDLVEELRQVEAELGRIEVALDETLALLRPGSDRSKERRTRNAMLEIGQSRMKSIQLVLDQAMRGDTTNRFEVRRPRLDAVSEDGKARVSVRLEKVPEE